MQDTEGVKNLENIISKENPPEIPPTKGGIKGDFNVFRR